MNVIYITPNPNPRLFPTFKKTFEVSRHTNTDNPNEATHCFIEIQSGDIRYDQELLSRIKDSGIPIIAFDSREYGPLNKDKWTPFELASPLIYFMRNMNKDEEYPINVYPFDWAYFKECDYPTVSKDELFNREFDICFMGTESPVRTNLINGLMADGRLKLNCEYRDHTQRFSKYSQFIDEHRKAKLYLSCDGAGFTNERPNQLFSVSAMLKNKNQHKAANPFTDLQNCIEINEPPTKEDIDKVLEVINDKDKLYDIYLNGYCHTKNFYSEEWAANYILKKINKWN